VAGWAENRGDGTVEAVFEGGAEAVDAMVAFVRAGPGHATVSAVDVASEEPQGLSGFSTR
jgi:acylphosphatase